MLNPASGLNYESGKTNGDSARSAGPNPILRCEGSGDSWIKWNTGRLSSPPKRRPSFWEFPFLQSSHVCFMLGRSYERTRIDPPKRDPQFWNGARGSTNGLGT
jgi:hypothetical protein